MTEWGPGLAVLLGLVEGLTEYLPISSTGHLILVGHWLGFTGEVATSVEISIQLGSILAVVAYERSKLSALLSHGAAEFTAVRALMQDPRPWRLRLSHSIGAHRNLWFFIGLGGAFLPAACIGLLAHKWIEAHLFNPVTVAAALIVGGLIILVVEAMQGRVRIIGLERVGLSSAIWVGLAQCASLIPGVSRSGATIVGGLLAGMDRRTATEYSFFLALPTMIAATGYKLLKSRDLLTSADLLALALGLLVAFFVAWAVIAAFLAFVKRHSLRTFAYYRILLGITVLLVFR